MTDASLKTPGLYLRALENEPLAPSPTAQTAFVGVTERGPLDSPQIVGSFGDFVAVFGNPWLYGSVGDSVYAFFLNGGEEACVVRVARSGPLAAPPVGGCTAKQELAAAVPPAAIVDANGAETLRLFARNAGTWGNQIAVTLADSSRQLDLAELRAPVLAGATVLAVSTVYDFRKTGALRLTHALNPFLKSTHEVTDIDEVAGTLTISPAVPNDYPARSSLTGPGFKLTVTDGDRVETFDALSVNPAHPNHFVDAINGPGNLSYLELARRKHSLLVTASQTFGPLGQPRFKPVAATVAAFEGGGDGLTFATGTLNDASAQPSVVLVARVAGRAGAGLTVAASPFGTRLSLPVPAASGGATDELSVDASDGFVVGDVVTVTSADSAAIHATATVVAVDQDRHRLALLTALGPAFPLGSSVGVAGRFDLTLTPPDPSETAEVFVNLALGSGPRFFASIVNASSLLVCVSVATGASAPPSGTTLLSGGTDPDEVPLSAWTGYNDDGSLFQAPGGSGLVGLATLEGVPSVSLVTAGDLVSRGDLGDSERLRAQTLVLFHCRKLGDRCALLDVPWSLDDAHALEWAEHFTEPTLARYGALYYPWLNVAMADGDRWLPPCGLVAGAFATTDRRGGVGQAPANVTLKGVVALESDIDAPAQAVLNDAGVNCIRKFEVGAVRLWGARTLSREDQYLYVHSRRVVLLIIKGLSSGLRWAVFEPNDDGLRRRVKTAIEGFLRGVLVRNTSGGGRVDDAFFVNVGSDLNTAATRDAGQLIAEVGVSLTKAAEFIVITVKRTPDILTLVEEET